MKTAFQWQGAPSLIGQGLMNQKAKLPDLEPKRLNVYQEATISDATREAEITQTNIEVERHFALAQTTDEPLRTIHREEARRLAAKARALILGRSAGFVAKLEQERGLV